MTVLQPGDTVTFGDDGSESINPKPSEDLPEVRTTEGRG